MSLLEGHTYAAWADAVILSWGFSGVEANIHWNIGATYSNWASDVRLGIYDIDINSGEGDIYSWVASPFPDQFSGGGGTSGTYSHHIGTDFSSGDVSSYGYHVGSEGDIGAGGYSTWDDGTGLNAGIFTSGTVWVNIDTIPAPAALALLGLAGLAGSGRRRR